MTCIIGMVDKGNIIMAGDSIGWANGSDARPVSNPKAYKVQDKPILIGSAGSFRSHQIIKHNPQVFPNLLKSEKYDIEYLIKKFVPSLIKLFASNGWEKKDSTGETEGATFLIGMESRLYKMQSDFSIVEGTLDFESIGSGKYLALGSMYGTKDMGLPPVGRLGLAFKAADYYVPSICGPFSWVTLEDQGVIE